MFPTCVDRFGGQKRSKTATNKKKNKEKINR